MKLIKATFLAGARNRFISPQGQAAYSWRVSSLKDLVNIIIPHFDKYLLISQKRADFELFKREVDQINRQEGMVMKGRNKRGNDDNEE